MGSTGRAAKLAASSAAEFTFLGFPKPLNSQSLSRAMEAGPLSSSLLARREEVAEQQQQVISDDQIRQLLIFMGTITVISFVLVIALITVFIAFIWFSRSRLQGCSCHNRGKEKELGGGGGELGGAVGQQGHLRHHGLSSGPHTVKMFAVDPGQFQLRSHKNVIVNPLPGSSGPGGVADLGGNDLVGVAVNQSVAGPQAR